MDLVLAKAQRAPNPHRGQISLSDQPVDSHPGYSQERGNLAHGYEPSLDEGFLYHVPRVYPNAPSGR